eukprot:7082379-Lingulodinium_polyedra.AAC.1
MARADASQRRLRPQRTAAFGVLHGTRPSGRWRVQLPETVTHSEHDHEAHATVPPLAQHVVLTSTPRCR